jgi:hypothetical protein
MFVCVCGERAWSAGCRRRGTAKCRRKTSLIIISRRPITNLNKLPLELAGAPRAGSAGGAGGAAVPVAARRRPAAPARRRQARRLSLIHMTIWRRPNGRADAACSLGRRQWRALHGRPPAHDHKPRPGRRQPRRANLSPSKLLWQEARAPVAPVQFMAAERHEHGRQPLVVFAPITTSGQTSRRDYVRAGVAAEGASMQFPTRAGAAESAACRRAERGHVTPIRRSDGGGASTTSGRAQSVIHTTLVLKWARACATSRRRVFSVSPLGSSSAHSS